MSYTTHPDPIVDRAHRANAGAGFHFFNTDSARFHGSKSVAGVLSHGGRYALVIERYRTRAMGGVVVQTPHSRIVRVDLKTGKTDYLTFDGKPTSEMIGDRYVKNGEKAEYSTNARAMKAAQKFAKESEGA